jgi:hypothetical protein
MNMRKRSVILLALLLGAPGLALASPITYDVTVDTSSLALTPGSLDFQFNPGPLVTQSATLQVLNFASDGAPVVLTTQLTGDVSGTLAGGLTFGNTTGYNDYFTGFSYGNALSFNVSLDGPALTSPDGSSTSGSSFAFSVFSDAAGINPALTSDPNGSAFTVDVNLDGTTTLTNFSAAATVVPATAVNPVPEPTSLWLLGSGLAGLVAKFRRKI